MTDNTLTYEQLVKLKDLLAQAKAAGQPLTYVASHYTEYSYKSVKYWNKRFKSDPDYLQKLEQDGKNAKKIEQLLIRAKENNKSLSDIARENPEFNLNKLKYHNGILKILDVKKRKTYTHSEKIAILSYAARNGIMAASRRFNINNVTISEWNEPLHIFKAKKNPKAIPSAQRAVILREVRDYNIFHGNCKGVMVVSKKHGLNYRTLYCWNKTLNIFKTRTGGKRKTISEQEEQVIIEKAALYDNISELSRTVGRSKETLKNILTAHGICYCNGHNRNS
ncbi:MAG: hypothetical protein LBJ73_01130 [Rickettsiales bacterium]|jgi:hypothetical protein|nr:hypothetical protein [Rickettsiales bacterium]